MDRYFKILDDMNIGYFKDYDDGIEDDFLSSVNIDNVKGDNRDDIYAEDSVIHGIKRTNGDNVYGINGFYNGEEDMKNLYPLVAYLLGYENLLISFISNDDRNGIDMGIFMDKKK